MKDIYKLHLDAIVNELDETPDLPFNKAGMLLEFIHALICLYLMLIGETQVLLAIELRHIDDSTIKARYN